jgi:protein-tyrosine phosphatase
VGTIVSMSGFTDIHSHVLPGIDDGPSDLAGAIAMARAAFETGTETIVATPHLRSDFPNVRVGELVQRCRDLQDAVERDGVAVEIVCGAEVSLVWALEANDHDLVLATYNRRGTDLLIETPSGGVVGLDRLLYELRTKGVRVTLAHPERNRDFQRDHDTLRTLVSQGVLLQVNADSLLDAARRSPVRRLAERLCQEELVAAIASDGHRASSWRPVTRLAQAASAVSALVGPERAQWMVNAAPAAIVQGVPLPAAPPLLGRSRGRGSKIFGRT